MKHTLSIIFLGSLILTGIVAYRAMFLGEASQVPSQREGISGAQNIEPSSLATSTPAAQEETSSAAESEPVQAAAVSPPGSPRADVDSVAGPGRSAPAPQRQSQRSPTAPRPGSSDEEKYEKSTAAKLGEVLNDPTVDWSDPAERAAAVQRMKAIEDGELARAQAVARQQGRPLREKLPDGTVLELVGLDEEGGLLYVETKNVNAAISTGANLAHSTYAIDGSGLKVGVWDADSALVTHQEFNEGATSRINNKNAQPTDDHATHVAGTIGAYGVDSGAKGMAFKAIIDSYDWTNDDSEMTAAGAFAAGQFDTKVYVSNHSYGYSYGWDNGSGTWVWSATGADQNAYDPDFGQYSNISVNMDNIAVNSPYYLIFWAAGNENNDGPNNGNTVTINGTTGITYNSSIHPQNDGDYRNGFETIGDEGIAKNLITVGAANDAVTSGQRDPSKATIASFSSTGPCDDGRIKPDLTGNGVGLRSPVDTGDTAYGSKSGTSMATPNLTGSAALLVGQYRDLFGTDAAMRASTLKGLLIHTATDIGNPGPDYTYGWGLVNVKTAADLLQKQADYPDLESVIEDEVTTAQPTRTYTFSWDGVSEIRATLSWTDPAGPSQSAHDDRSPDLVNDLNLKLIAPDGSQYFPFVMPFVGTWTVASMSLPATTGVNNVDNVEQILVQNPGQAGAWQVEVSYLGTLRNNEQDFGLIISGAGTAGALAFSPAVYTVDEDGGPVAVTVDRLGGTTGAVSVDYATSDGTAQSGSDYTASSGTLSWADGESGSKSFNVAIANDGTSESYEESFSVTLANAVGTTLSGSASATITIRDDEPIMAVTAPNGGEEFAVGTVTTITWASSLGGTVRIELIRNDINYTTIAASTANDGSYAWTLPVFVPTGSDYRVRVTSLGGGGQFDESNGTFAVDNQQANVDIYTATMDANPGWTLQGDWEYGVPQGNEGDPSSGKTGNNVIGYNLDGDYTNSLAPTYATTPAIDCSGYTNVSLAFYRWLGMESSTYDDASIQVSTNGTNWTTVWEHSGSTFTDTSWKYLTYDISAVADQQATVYIRWVMGGTDTSVTYCGWNIDDVVVSGLGSAENPAGEVGFSSALFTVAEDGGSALITVNRNGGTVGAVTVDYATSDGTAVAGSDYTPTTGTLSWANGDGAPKTFSVSVTNDSSHEDFIEDIILTLSNTVGATIAEDYQAGLEIVDDDNTAPVVEAGDGQFAAWQVQIDVPGLYYGTVPGNIDLTTPNPETQILTNVASQTENSIASNTTEIYTGSIYDADGQISFTENIDDKARIWIDDVLVLNNDAWSVRTSTANLNLAPGWHTIEIRISNGTGGSGPASGIGIGYDPAGGTNWQTLVDPGDGSFLKVNQQSSGAQADLAGSASDLDGDPLTTTWSQVSGPGSVTFGDAAALDTTASFDAQGVYTLRLTADDGREQTTDDVVITVGIPGLSLVIEEDSISENGGSSNATVTRQSTAGDLIVNLSSDDESEATVPASVTILDGQASANLTITAQDDALVDGARTVTITATADGNPDATDTIEIADDEVATLTLEVLAPRVGESDGPGATIATVTRNSVTTDEMIVNLGSSDTSEAIVPATVTIAAGQSTSPAFDITAVDDALVDGTQTVTLTASFAGHTAGTDTLDVDDDAPLTLTVVTGAGGASTTGGGIHDPDANPFAITAAPLTGYTFAQWTVTSGSATFADGNSASTTVSAAGDATVQANFALATYTVRYDGNGNDGGSAPDNQIKTHGEGLPLSGPGDLTRTGYSFNEWNTEANGSGTAYAAGATYPVDADVTLYAQWAANSYTVTFDANGGDTPVPTSTSVTFNAPYGTLASTSRPGYALIGWFTQLSGGTRVDEATIVTTAADHTLYARWADSLTWDANGTGTGQTNGGGAWFGSGLWWNGLANTDWTSGSNAVFGGPATAGGAVTLTGPTAVESIIFDPFTGTYTLGTAGQAITLNGGIIKNANSGAVSIVSPVTLGGHQTWTNNSSGSLTTSNGTNLIDNGGFDITIDGTGTTSFGVVSNSAATLTGSGALIKNGSGRLSVGGVNSGLTGTVTINGGVMQVYNSNDPMGSGNLTLNGGVMSWYWGATYSRTLGTGDNQVQIPGGESGFAGSGSTGPSINLGGTVVWGASGEGAATGFFNPSKFVLGDEGTGNAAATTFSNGIDLNGVTRSIIVPKGLNSSGNISTILGAIISTGPAGLIKEGGGTLVLTSANTYPGDTIISDGSLRIGNNSAGSLTGGNYSGNISIAEGATLQIWSTTAQTLSGTISGGGGLNKAYSGTLTLTGPNTYTGRTSFLPQTTAGCTINITSFNSVNGGTPAMASSSLGAPTTIEDGTIDVGSSGKRANVTVNYTGPGEITDRVIHFGFNDTASQTLSASGSGLLKFTSAMTSSPIGTQTGSLILRGTGSGEITEALPALPSGGLAKSDSGTWTLGGANAYTGPTTISAGELFINGDQSAATGNVSISAGATLGGRGALGGHVTVAANGKLEFDIAASAASHDPLNIASGRDFTFSGASELTVTSSGGASPGIYTLLTGGNNITGSAPATVNLPANWIATVSISGNSLLLDVTSVGGTTYSVTYDGNDNDGGTAPVDGGSYSPDATVTVLGNTGGLFKAGHNFAGWNTAANGSGTGYAANDTFSITGNVTLYAQWTENPGNTFSDWIDGYDLGGLTAPTDDPDGDGNTNAEENYFGTHPGERSTTLVGGEVTVGETSTIFTFTHPINANAAADLTATYIWSKDLSTFRTNGDTDPDGTTVTFVQSAPVNGMVTVTATITGTAASRIFLGVEVTQP